MLRRPAPMIEVCVAFSILFFPPRFRHGQENRRQSPRTQRGDVSREQERGRWVRATSLEPQTLMSALLLCTTLCQVSHQIYDPHTRTLPGLERKREREGASPFSLSLSLLYLPDPALDLVRAVKLLRIKLYTQITSTPTLSHFAGAAGAVARFSRHRGSPTSDVSLHRGVCD